MLAEPKLVSEFYVLCEKDPEFPGHLLEKVVEAVREKHISFFQSTSLRPLEERDTLRPEYSMSFNLPHNPWSNAVGKSGTQNHAELKERLLSLEEHIE